MSFSSSPRYHLEGIKSEYWAKLESGSSPRVHWEAVDGRSRWAVPLMSMIQLELPQAEMPQLPTAPLSSPLTAAAAFLGDSMNWGENRSSALFTELDA
jgi:hypothetical protein